MIQADCHAGGGSYQGDFTTCTPDLCTPFDQGACCFNDGSCINAIPADCTALGGSFQSTGTNCAAVICPTSGPRVSSTDKGSLLIFSEVTIKWRTATGDPPHLIQDTFISITNDYPDDVLVQMYFINGDPPLPAMP